MTTLRCPECGTPHPDPPDPAKLPRDTTVYVTCEWCEARYKATVYSPGPDVRDEIPPGMLAVAQLVGGGTTTVCGNLRGNTAITSQKQAQAVQRMTDQSVTVQNITANHASTPAPGAVRDAVQNAKSRRRKRNER